MVGTMSSWPIGAETVPGATRVGSHTSTQLRVTGARRSKEWFAQGSSRPSP